ncbi:MAG: SIR2 family protein [Anaerolineae bacterium]|nr:SIR2 family protein [Anaerolineae bacterium]
MSHPTSPDKQRAFDSFYKAYTEALTDGRAALFVGAGVSSGAGLPTWPRLLREVAQDLGLDIERETDLVSLAQFHLNREASQRNRLNQIIRDNFAHTEDKGIDLTDDHRLIGQLPVETVWTTNYDDLLERAFRSQQKLCDVKITRADFSAPTRGSDVSIFKMHGDANTPENATLTKDDYERYSVRHDWFINALKGDLVSKVFLFVGFSFTDPNIDYILSRIRLSMETDTGHHYCIMRNPQKPDDDSGDAQARYDYDMRRLALRIEDLKRYGITALMVDSFSEITTLLKELNRRASARNLFVSGSAHDHTGEGGMARLQKLSYRLGEHIIREGYNLINGFGLGIGREVLTGSLEQFYRGRSGVHKTPRMGVLNERVRLYPFPRIEDEAKRKETYDKYRRNMLASVGFTIFIAGNKLDTETDQVVDSPGVRDEFDLSVALGAYPIPIGATGSMSKHLWQQVMADPQKYYGNVDVRAPLEVLGDETAKDDALLNAVFAIIHAINSAPR